MLTRKAFKALCPKSLLDFLIQQMISKANLTTDPRILFIIFKLFLHSECPIFVTYPNFTYFSQSRPSPTHSHISSDATTTFNYFSLNCIYFLQKITHYFIQSLKTVHLCLPTGQQLGELLRAGEYF